MQKQGDIVDRCRRGDPDALEQVLREHGPAVLRLLVRYVGDLDRAEELFQETWLRVKVGLKGFRGQAHIGTWIYRIALNLARDDRRRRQRKVDWAEVARDQHGGPAIDGAERHEELARLYRAIDELPELQREALVLNKLHGMSYREMAELTGSTEGTLRSRVHWAMVALRRQLTMRQPE